MSFLLMMQSYTLFAMWQNIFLYVVKNPYFCIRKKVYYGTI